MNINWRGTESPGSRNLATPKVESAKLYGGRLYDVKGTLVAIEQVLFLRSDVEWSTLGVTHEIGR